MQMKQDNLKNKAVSGVMWTAVQKYSTMLISFISGIVLARLLSPADYGSIGMLAIFMSLAQVFIDAGFGSALIQKKQPTQTDYSTVFYFNIVMSLVLYVVLYFSAPIIASFYHMNILCDILRVQGVVLFIYSLNVIQQNQIRKNLQFKKLSKISISTSIIALLITVAMAYSGFGVWSLVVQNILAALIPCIFFWITTKWHPTWEYSWDSFKELFNFGAFMFLTHLFEAFSSKVSGLLIGRWFNSDTMGYYSKASTTENMASLSISGVLIQTTYPLYASIQDDKKRLSNVIRRIVMSLSYITFPLMFLLILVAKPLFIILYSEKWLPAVPYFQILCIAGLATCLQAVNYQSIAAIGKSKTRMYWTFINKMIGLILQIVGLIYGGMKGLMIGFVLSAWFSYIVNISLVSKYVGYSYIIQIKDILSVLIVSIFAAIGSYYIVSAFSMSIYMDATLKIIVFTAIYVGWSFISKPQAFKYAISIITDYKNKNKTTI